MRALKILPLLPLTTAVILLLFAGYAYPEQIQGNLRSLAEDAKVFTLDYEQGKILFFVYNKATRWTNVKNPDELEPGDFLFVEFSRTDDLRTAVSVTKPATTPPSGLTVVSTENLASSLTRYGKELPFTLIDSRPVEHFDAAHLPGAVSIPFARLRKQSAELLPENKQTPLLFYDRGAGGTDAVESAKLAKTAGYNNISVYTEGVNGWIRSGRFAASSTTFIRKSRPALIDLRDEEIAAKGHLNGAVNIPEMKLPSMIKFFPPDKLSSIVLYGESDQQAVSSAKIIRDWGYRNVTIFAGGITSWVASAEVLNTGPLETYATLTGSMHSRQFGTKDFEMALNSPFIVEIVDVRSSADYKQGSFPGSKHIPLQELPLRHNELSKNKFQVIFGSDGQSAEMAADFLRPLGYRVNYLNGRVEFFNDGKYRIK